MIMITVKEYQTAARVSCRQVYLIMSSSLYSSSHRTPLKAQRGSDIDKVQCCIYEVVFATKQVKRHYLYHYLYA